jgi:hypothetical protein
MIHLAQIELINCVKERFYKLKENHRSGPKKLGKTAAFEDI